jgi:hypothetical protein
LGDILAWFPYAVRFGETHRCRLTRAMSLLIIPLLRGSDPGIDFVTHEQVTERKLEDFAYATDNLGMDSTEAPRGSSCPTKVGRSRISMSASPCRAPHKPNTRETPPAGPL